MNDELKNKPEVEIKYEVDTPIFNPTNPLQKITGLFKTVTVAPTRAPRSIYEQIQLYVSGTTVRLYIYDTENNAWRTLINTTTVQSAIASPSGGGVAGVDTPARTAIDSIRTTLSNFGMISP